MKAAFRTMMLQKRTALNKLLHNNDYTWYFPLVEPILDIAIIVLKILYKLFWVKSGFDVNAYNACMKSSHSGFFCLFYSNEVLITAYRNANISEEPCKTAKIAFWSAKDPDLDVTP